MKAVDKSKRSFCKRYLFRQIEKVFEGFEEGLQEARQSLAFDDFFESYESSYALTLAYPDDILIETAHQYGIDTEGRERNEVVKELFEKYGGFGS
jgi:hypothetical protein